MRANPLTSLVGTVRLPRINVRTLMAVVAVSAVVIYAGVCCRRERDRRLAKAAYSEARIKEIFFGPNVNVKEHPLGPYYGYYSFDKKSGTTRYIDRSVAQGLSRRARGYRDAARTPWLPVRADLTIYSPEVDGPPSQK